MIPRDLTYDRHTDNIYIYNYIYIYHAKSRLNTPVWGLASLAQLKKMSWCETEMQKYMPLVKQNVMKFEVLILGGQRIDQKRNKGWWRGSRERIEMEAQKVTELTIEEEDKEHLHLPLLVSSRCVSSEFPTRFCSKALQQ